MRRHHFWYARRHGGCGDFEPAFAWAAGRARGRHGADEGPRGVDLNFSFGGGEDEAGGAGLGVRRPLRFLAWKLELDDEQLGEVAMILSELKTEVAQGEVDRAKRLAAFADAVSAEAFDATRAGEFPSGRHVCCAYGPGWGTHRAVRLRAFPATTSCC